VALTATALRMMGYLPDYYDGNPIVERIIQARANEIDRVDARIDTLKTGMVPGTATDDLKLLRIWERMLGLPIAPAGATTSQRQTTIKVKLQRLSAETAGDVIDLLTEAVGTSFMITRNSPGALQDIITVPFPPGSYQASEVERIALTVWPAHRTVFVFFSSGPSSGFILDGSLLDQDAL
jgi:uncharacterized protein YmfQ (DUF2313 family)